MRPVRGDHLRWQVIVAIESLRREDRPSLRGEEVAMPLYLTRFSYTPEAWAKLIKEPEDRRETIGPLLEAVGGKLHGLWYAFGDHDGYVLSEGPDNTTVASVLVTVAGSGAFRSVSTTVLLTVEETLDALRRAQSVAYRPPGG
jgi:uncharacterized protein with GYD domain